MCAKTTPPASHSTVVDPDRMVPVSLSVQSRRGVLCGAPAVAGGTAGTVVALVVTE